MARIHPPQHEPAYQSRRLLALIDVQASGRRGDLSFAEREDELCHSCELADTCRHAATTRSVPSTILYVARSGWVRGCSRSTLSVGDLRGNHTMCKEPVIAAPPNRNECYPANMFAHSRMVHFVMEPSTKNGS